MKRLLAIALTLALAFMLVACGGDGTTTTGTTGGNETASGGSTDTGGNAPTGGSESAQVTTPSEPDGFELALITDVGTIDDKSFNQGAWEGLKKFADETGKTIKYYQPIDEGTNYYLDAIKLAVDGGARIVVTPGFLFEEPIFIAQDLYPSVNFILLDGTPHDADYGEFRTAPNTVGVTYAEEQSGFLAGYAAVKDGYRDLGFMGGMAVPAVVRFGYGYVVGADYAANELALGAGGISIRYHYTDVFWPTPEAQTMAASWFSAGVSVIFACGGGMGNSVMAAAEAANANVIGVDIDQASEPPTIITSAMKELAISVYETVKEYYDGNWRGGQNIVFTAENHGVGLPMATSRFNTFSVADYDAIYAKLASNSIEIFKDVSDDVTAADIPVSCANVTVVG